LGVTFLAKNTSTGIESRWFFSAQDYENSVQGKQAGDLQHSYLSLGDNLADWHDATADLTSKIYPELLDDFREIFATWGSGSISCRQAEVLVGGLAKSTAKRIARATKQIQLLGDSYSVNDLQINGFDLPNLRTPRSTDDSYRLLASEEMGCLIQMIALRRHFELPTKACLIMESSYAHLESKENEAKKSLMTRLYLNVQKHLSARSSKNSVSIGATYLGRGHEILLSLILGQTPSLLEVRPPLEAAHYVSSRECLLLENDSIRATAFFPMTILAPSSLVEGYSASLKRAYSLGFARNPSVIFTSNSFDTDDEFKVHLAEALPSAAYVVGQHGNNYSISRTAEIYPEQNASDVLLSWGWGGKEHGVHPFGQIKPALRGKFPNNVKGVTLFLRVDYDLYFAQADMHGLNHRYFTRVEELCTSLNDLQITTHLRLHTSTSCFTKNFLEKAIEEMPFVTIPKDRPSMRKLLASGMGIVFGYDSTGMLEMGTAGIPFFLFAPDGLGLVRQEFQTNYDSLKSAGLLSEEPAQAAQLIHTWISASKEERKAQREAIQNFTKGIAHQPKNKLRALRKILKNADEYVAHTRLEEKVQNTD
jgi:putative transferase (TIGR04331 family)